MCDILEKANQWEWRRDGNRQDWERGRCDSQQATQGGFGVRELLFLRLWAFSSGSALGRVQAENRWHVSLLKELLPW